MKIKRVKWKEHPILGNLELDFTNHETGLPYEAIVFAGENGTGKTTILETLSTFLNLGSFEPFEFIEYAIDENIYKAVPNARSNHPSFFTINYPDGASRDVYSDMNNNRDTINDDNLDIRHYGCVYSKARADYKTGRIQYATSSQLDTDKYDTDDEDNFTSLKQLIVDVENQDNADYAEENRTRGGRPLPWDEFYTDSKIYRFKNAFDNFFEKIKYDRVNDVDNGKDILFNKEGVRISIDSLSTGEKQIVFRGIYLLRNSQNINGAKIMIDEPELSMHPKWQRKIYNYYKNLFTEGTNQKAQIFFATHSEHVIKDAIVDPKCIVIILKEENNTITSKKINAPTCLPVITAAETNYLAFDLATVDYHIELYGWLQEKTNNDKVKSCDNYIMSHVLYDPALHEKNSGHGRITYNTLCTYVRNAIHHPETGQTYTESELRTSIELLRKLCV